MGNQLTREYDIKEQQASAGLWKIYSAVKKATGKHVSIFVILLLLIIFCFFLNFYFILFILLLFISNTKCFSYLKRNTLTNSVKNLQEKYRRGFVRTWKKRSCSHFSLFYLFFFFSLRVPFLIELFIKGNSISQAKTSLRSRSYWTCWRIKRRNRFQIFLSLI